MKPGPLSLSSAQVAAEPPCDAELPGDVQPGPVLPKGLCGDLRLATQQFVLLHNLYGGALPIDLADAIERRQSPGPGPCAVQRVSCTVQQKPAAAQHVFLPAANAQASWCTASCPS